MQIKGSFQHAMGIRKEGILKRTRDKMERDLIEEKKKGVKGKIMKIWKCLFTTMIILVIMAIILPIAAVNYVRYQIAIGEWGEGEFNSTVTDTVYTKYQDVPVRNHSDHYP